MQPKLGKETNPREKEGNDTSPLHLEVQGGKVEIMASTKTTGRSRNIRTGVRE